VGGNEKALNTRKKVPILRESSYMKELSREGGKKYRRGNLRRGEGKGGKEMKTGMGGQ